MLPAGPEWLLLVNFLSPHNEFVSNHELKIPHTVDFAPSPVPVLPHTGFSSFSSMKEGLCHPNSAQTKAGTPPPSPQEEHSLSHWSFGNAHQIKLPETQEEPLTAASLLDKLERQFPSHIKDFHGIAANPFVLSRNLKSKENNHVAPFVLIHCFKCLDNQQGGLSSLHAQNSPQMLKLIAAATGDVHRLIYSIWEVTQVAAVIVNVLYYCRHWVRICDDQLQRSFFHLSVINQVFPDILLAKFQKVLMIIRLKQETAPAEYCNWKKPNIVLAFCLD